MILVHVDGEIIHIEPRGVVDGRSIKVGENVTCELGVGTPVEIPEQDTSHLYIKREDGSRYIVGRYPDGVVVFTAEERAALIDSDTGAAINKAIHQFCGISEQIGIIRDQVVHILNALGLEATADFQRLNKIAIEEIEKSRAEKEGLNA